MEFWAIRNETLGGWYGGWPGRVTNDPKGIRMYKRFDRCKKARDRLEGNFRIARMVITEKPYDAVDVEKGW